MTKFVHVKVLHCWKKLMQLQGALTNHPLDENVNCLFKKKKKTYKKITTYYLVFFPPCYFILNKYLSATSATNYSAYKSHSMSTIIFMLTFT